MIKNLKKILRRKPRNFQKKEKYNKLNLKKNHLKKYKMNMIRKLEIKVMKQLLKRELK